MINYNYGNKTASQSLGTMDTYDFEGDFGEVLNRFMAEYGNYKKYLEEPQEINLGKYSKYLDGVNKKTVKFTKLRLDWRETYDDTKQLHVVGERPMDEGELAAYAEEVEKSKDREIAQLKLLREKYPNA